MVRQVPGRLDRDMPPFARPSPGFTDLQTGGLDGPPVRPNISLGDSVAGLHAAFGTVLALLARQKNNGKGSTVDVSIIERWDRRLTPFHTAQQRTSILNLMEGIIPEYVEPCND